MLDEQKLIAIAKPYFESCRDGDWNHALRVVKWAKILSKGRSDRDIIITAAYLHDIGWSGVIKKGKVKFDQMLKLESQANANTALFTKKVLNELDFSQRDIKTVIRLIEAADRHESFAKDEEILVDADSLSKLCVDHLKEKYSKESYKKVILTWDNEFPLRIKTELGKQKYPVLLENLKKEFKIKN